MPRARCNGRDCVAFLEAHGQSGRVLLDQPALWTENEGGFQTWGGAPPPGGRVGKSIKNQVARRWCASHTPEPVALPLTKPVLAT